MFHVKLHSRRLIITAIGAIFLLLLTTNACMIQRQIIQIPDYILVPNGKENIGGNNLTAFIFENNMKNIPIEAFLSNKFKTNSFYQNEIWITADGQKFKLIIYDYNEFEKYFVSSNYSQMNVLPENARSPDQRKFIAISMINAVNDDCLADGSLLQNVAVNYLKNLKDEYIRSNGNLR